MTKDEALRMALKKAFDLGGRYWSWADSEYSSHWKKADAAKQQFDQFIEDTIREALAQPEQEPVAWVCYGSASDEKHTIDYQQEDIDAIPVGTMLYTTPPQRKPLTHPQIHELDWPDSVSFEDILPFVRAIEAAHGIKGEA